LGNIDPIRRELREIFQPQNGGTRRQAVQFVGPHIDFVPPAPPARKISF
jgi:hypothetical protein